VAAQVTAPGCGYLRTGAPEPARRSGQEVTVDPDYPLLSVFLYMLWFFAFVLWLFLLFQVLIDIFRSRDLAGLGKALWTVAVVLFPLVGVLAYLIVRGASMQERTRREADREDRAFRAYVRDAAGGGSAAEELGRLSELHDRGVLSDDEFEQMKRKILV
jgi:hypothetical protein